MAITHIYVDPDATGGGTGVDWINAYTSLNAAEGDYDIAWDGDNCLIHCRSLSGGDDTIAVSFSGASFNDADDYATIQNEDDHEGKWNDTIYKLAVKMYEILNGKTIINPDILLEVVLRLACKFIFLTSSVEPVKYKGHLTPEEIFPYEMEVCNHIKFMFPIFD